MSDIATTTATGYEDEDQSNNHRGYKDDVRAHMILGLSKRRRKITPCRDHTIRNNNNGPIDPTVNLHYLNTKILELLMLI